MELTLSKGKVLDSKNQTELETLNYIYGDNESDYVYAKPGKKIPYIRF